LHFEPVIIIERTVQRTTDHCYKAHTSFLIDNLAVVDKTDDQCERISVLGFDADR